MNVDEGKEDLQRIRKEEPEREKERKKLERSRIKSEERNENFRKK